MNRDGDYPDDCETDERPRCAGCDELLTARETEESPEEGLACSGCVPPAGADESDDGNRWGRHRPAKQPAGSWGWS